ncbi:MAG: hypothetical protein GYB66_02275 [Chloroflexi bacterium]|nr:hypothetical protein [Chloroflexota bacterium]
MAQRYQRKMPNRSEPMYGWALDQRGRPLPIAAAKRGAHGYRCPVCGGAMVARKGEVKQYHFAHEELTHCTPERVAAAIAGKWLVLELGRRMVLGQPCPIQWTIGERTYSADLMKDITAIVENLEAEPGKADIALVDADQQLRAVINISEPADELALARFAAAGITTITLPAEHFRSGQMDLTSLLAISTIRAGWGLLEDDAKPGNLITDPKRFRELLTGTVQHPPFRFWSRLQNIGSHKDVLPLGEDYLWLPPEIWRDAFGGSINRLSHDLVITITELPQSDGGIVALFYISLRGDERAVAIRRFGPGEQVSAKLNAAYQIRRTTVEDVARLLATTS